jgi:hypothetical protein
MKTVSFKDAAILTYMTRSSQLSSSERAAFTSALSPAAKQIARCVKSASSDLSRAKPSKKRKVAKRKGTFPIAPKSLQHVGE